MAFNFLSGQNLQPQQLQQLQQFFQQVQQPVQGANVAQWAQAPAQAAQPPLSGLAGMQSMPSYAQNPLSNQGANGFSLGDYLQRAQSNGMNLNQAMGGLQSMLKAWGSHS